MNARHCDALIPEQCPAGSARSRLPALLYSTVAATAALWRHDGSRKINNACTEPSAFSGPTTSTWSPTLRSTRSSTTATDCSPGPRSQRRLDQPGDVVFKHASATGCEGIISKRKDSRAIG